MPFRIVIEILNVEEPACRQLIIKGYKLSRYGRVAFILNGIKPREINNVLDPIVPTIKLDIPGVTYINISATTEVEKAISSAKLIVSRSGVFTGMVRHMNTYKPSRSAGRQLLFRPYPTPLSKLTDGQEFGAGRIHKVAIGHDAHPAQMLSSGP